MFEPCWEAGSLRFFLLPFACIAVVVYVVCYLALVAQKLCMNTLKAPGDEGPAVASRGHRRCTVPAGSSPEAPTLRRTRPLNGNQLRG